MWVIRHSVVDWECSKSRLCWGPWIFEINFGSQTCVPFSWMCKKQTSVSHSSTRSEVISLDAGLLMDGIPALDLWDVVIEVLHSFHNVRASGNRSRDESQSKQININTKTKKHGNRENVEFSNVDHVVTSAMSKPYSIFLSTTKQWSRWSKKSRSPTMRHVSRTHRVALDWLFDRINLDPKSKSNMLTP